MQDALTAAASAWSLTEPQLIAETPRAWVYRVRMRCGIPAALKLANPAVDGDEARAPDWLRWADGRAAARVLEAAPGRLLLEWIDGPALSTLTHTGRDAEATQILGALVRGHLAIDAPYAAPLPGMEDYAAALLSGDPQGWPDALRGDMGAARALCRELITSAPPPRPLHGDLHHGNVAHSPRGWLAFDPKGVLADPHYELANSFRNPLGAAALLRDPDRARQMARLFAAETGLDAHRLLRWAFVQSALSLLWCGAQYAPTPLDAEIVRMFRALAG